MGGSTGGAVQGSGGGSAEGRGMGGAGGSPGAQRAAIDDGKLFVDAASASDYPIDASTPPSVPVRPDGGAPRPPGDGNVATATVGAMKLTATFKQTGVDVTVVIKATACPPGTHKIQVHEGFACDDPTRGPVWNGKRGDGIGGPNSTITCDASQSASVTYTRSGSDPALNWTVGDHNAMTDVTQHPIFADDKCGTFF